MSKKEVLKGLQKRVDWMIENDRPSREIGKTIELVVKTAQEIFDEEQTDLFYERLAEELKKDGK